MDTVLRSPMYNDLERPCLNRAELFFTPDNHVGRRWNPLPAKQLCHTCPHKDECLETALSANPPIHFGVWGGKDEDERKAILACRRGECHQTCAHFFREPQWRP